MIEIENGISVGAAGTNLPKLRSRIGMVFQNFELFPHMRVADNLAIVELAREGMTMMCVTHEMGFAKTARLTSRKDVAVARQGRRVAAGFSHRNH